MLTLPTVVFISYWWFMPESTRWLVRKGRYGEAKAQISAVARENGVDVSAAQIESMITVAEAAQRKEDAAR